MLQTQYITIDEFNEYFSKDLVIQLGSQQNALAFLKRIEDRMEAFLSAKFYKNVRKLYPKFSDYQKEHYKLALLEQAIYILRNGDLSVDSGIDLEKGKVLSDIDLTNVSIARNAKTNLELCGLWNRHIKGSLDMESWLW